MRMRAGFVTRAALLPPLGAKLSMCTISSCGGQLRTNCSRRGLHRLTNVVNDALNQGGIVALGHHPDQRLRTGFADHKAATTLQLRLCSRNPLADAVRLQWRLTI